MGVAMFEIPLGELVWSGEQVLNSGRVWSGEWKPGEPFWSNGFLIEFAEPLPELRECVEWHDVLSVDERVEGVITLLYRLPGTVSAMALTGLTMAISHDECKSHCHHPPVCTVLTAPGTKGSLLAFVNAAFWSYLSHRYPGAEWRLRERHWATQPVHVTHEGRLVAAVCPMKPCWMCPGQAREWWSTARRICRERALDNRTWLEVPA